MAHGAPRFLETPILSVGSWSLVLARPNLDAEVAWRLARGAA
jgi:hypothetical protein